MAAFNFPNSPSVNDLHTENGVTFKWNGTIWNRFGPAYTDTTNLNVTGISTFAGNVSIADKIVHTGDTHTAIRFAGNDIITAEIGGNETLRIDSSGLKITDKLIHTGDTDTFLEFGTNTISLDTAGSERLRIGSAGQLGIAGANYGSSGQVLTSQGGSAAPQWATAAGGGKILQVVQEHRTDVWSESNVAPGAKTGAALTKAITTTANNLSLIHI